MKVAGIAGGIGGLIFLPVLFLLLFASQNPAACTAVFGAPGATVDPASVQSAPVDGYDHDQLVIAATIMDAAQKLGMDTQAQMIGVMTSMGESKLTNLDHGDGATNPDGSASCSLGILQQQWCLAGHPWGSESDVINPEHAATAFFKHLQAVNGCEQMTPSICAHRVQGNADPNYYTQFWNDAVDVVGALAGQHYTTSTASSTVSQTCSVGGNGNYAAAKGTPPAEWGGYANGDIPLSALAQIPWTTGTPNAADPWLGALYLRPDAEQALVALDTAFRAQFGYDIDINDAYRTLAEQEADKGTYGGEAATVGTSVHGLGLAVDFGTKSHNRIDTLSPEFIWLNANAGKFGFVQPSWAVAGGGGPFEPWHWEYWGKAS